ncbi:MAG: hypothetical protein ACXWW9_02765 [Actinomycetota bacterium]
MIAPAGPILAARLCRIALTLTLLGLFAAAPIAITWLTGQDFPSEPPTGLAVLSAAAFTAACILFLAAGRTAGAVVALPAISIGALLDDPETMALVLLFTAPMAEVAGVISARGFPAPVGAAWSRSFAEVRSATTRALGSGPLRPPARGPWLLDRVAVASAIGAAVAIAAWGVLVIAFGAGDDPTTRTVLPAATEFPWVLGIGLALAVVAAIVSFLTGRVPGVLMASPVVPAVWLDAPQRSEVVVVVLATACGLVSVLASPVPGNDDRTRVEQAPR